MGNIEKLLKKLKPFTSSPKYREDLSNIKYYAAEKKLVATDGIIMATCDVDLDVDYDLLFDPRSTLRYNAREVSYPDAMMLINNLSEKDVVTVDIVEIKTYSNCISEVFFSNGIVREFNPNLLKKLLKFVEIKGVEILLPVDRIQPLMLKNEGRAGYLMPMRSGAILGELVEGFDDVSKFLKSKNVKGSKR